MLGFLIRRCISIRGSMKNMKGAVADVDVHFPWWYFPIFGSQKIPGTSEFPLTKNHSFLMCQVSPCLWGALASSWSWLFANCSSEFFPKEIFAGELKSHELLNGCLLNCLFFNSLAGILPGHVEISPPIWVHPRWLLVAFLSLGWSLDPIQVDALDKGSATAGPRCRLVYAELSKYQVSNTWHPIDT